jgi:protocatechuate 4,5-dioxygenase beta chain
MKRAIELGGAIKAAVEAMPDDERVVVIGSGGISHWVGTPEMGKVNEAFDREIMDYACTGNLAGLAACPTNTSSRTAATVAWRSASGRSPWGPCPARGEVIDYAPVPEWVTGLGFVQLFA